MRKIYLIGVLMAVAYTWSHAQAPKWADKARRAVFSVVTYDADGKLLRTGNGFFVNEQGVALSDYALFEGAAKAVAIQSDGQQMMVESIMGADAMYDVVKFRVAISGKKVQTLTMAAVRPAAGATAYLLPYSTQKERTCVAGKVNAVDKVAGEYAYYTLDMPLKDKMVSCPLMNEAGEVFGLAQKSSGEDTVNVCYAVDARYAYDRAVTALSYNDRALQSIGIKKALPDTEEQALVFLYMASSQLSPENYLALLDDFVAQYPQSSDGYLRRASARLYMDEQAGAQVQADLDKALEVAVEKAAVHYERAKLVYNYLLSNPTPADARWSYDMALAEVNQAIALQSLPVYVKMKGDIEFAKADYPAALVSYEEVNHSDLASPATLFSVIRTKQLKGDSREECLALMDSCVAMFTKPYTSDAAPYLQERALMRMEAGQARQAVMDYDAFYDAVKGEVGDVFYYRRGQAALAGKQFQRALDDMSRAVELNPDELAYRAELALVNMRVGRNEEAVRILQEALAKDATYAEGHRLMGIAYLQLKKKTEACEQFAKAKELGDESAAELMAKHCK